MSLSHFDKDNFEKEVLLSSHPVLVDFWAPWCAPCRAQAPILEEVAEAMGTKVTIGKLNIDEELDLASRYSVMSIPTMVIFQGGKEVSRMVGVQTAEKLTEELTKYIG